MPTPLRMCHDDIVDIADNVSGSDYGRLVADDLEFLGMGELAKRRQARIWKPHVALMDAVLTDRSPGFAAAVRDRMISRPDSMVLYDQLLIDPVTRDFVDRRGNALAGLVMLHRVALHARLTSDDLGGEVVDMEVINRNDVHILLELDIPLAPDVSWLPGRVRLRRGLPSTISATVVGRRVKEIVSHPLLDDHGMTIVGWDGIDLQVQYDVPPTSVFD